MRRGVRHASHPAPRGGLRRTCSRRTGPPGPVRHFFFFKQKTAYEFGLGIPAEPLFRSLLVMRSNLWASGYDVDGTDQTSLGQFSGRVQQTYKHSVPRFFVPEHGTMFTLALVRFPPTATK